MAQQFKEQKIIIPENKFKEIISSKNKKIVDNEQKIEVKKKSAIQQKIQEKCSNENEKNIIQLENNNSPIENGNNSEKKIDNTMYKEQFEKSKQRKKSSNSSKQLIKPIQIASQPKSKPESKFESKPELKPESKPESKPGSKPESKSESKPESKPESQPNLKSKSKPKSKPKSNPKQKSKARPKQKSKSIPKSKTVPKAKATKSIVEKNLPRKRKLNNFLQTQKEQLLAYQNQIQQISNHCSNEQQNRNEQQSEQISRYQLRKLKQHGVEQQSNVDEINSKKVLEQQAIINNNVSVKAPAKQLKKQEKQEKKKKQKMNVIKKRKNKNAGELIVNSAQYEVRMIERDDINGQTIFEIKLQKSAVKPKELNSYCSMVCTVLQSFRYQLKVQVGDEVLTLSKNDTFAINKNEVYSIINLSSRGTAIIRCVAQDN